MKYKIPFIKPSFPSTDDLLIDYENIISSNWFTNFGPYEKKFSIAMANFIGKHVYASTISNCTLGLEAAISILLSSSKKNVIIPSFTFAAGAEALIRNGFDPVFIDIDNETWQPNIEQAEILLTKYGDNIAGILLCNIFGVGNENITEWELLAKKKNIPLIIDSAAGFGSVYPDGTMVGGRGDCEIFSMHATKPFAVGEGGIVASRSEEFIEKVRSWQNFGFEEDRNVHRIGTNAKLQEINAAIGLRQLKAYKKRLENRRKVLDIFKQRLTKYGFNFQKNDNLSTVPFASMVVNEAEQIYHKLLQSGIEVRRYYSPLHNQQLFKKYNHINVSLTVTEKISSSILSLPVYDNMNDKDLNYITKVIEKYYDKKIS